MGVHYGIRALRELVPQFAKYLKTIELTLWEGNFLPSPFALFLNVPSVYSG